MPCHAGTGSSRCGRGGLLYSKHILCEMENSMALVRWKGIAHPRTWEPARVYWKVRDGLCLPHPPSGSRAASSRPGGTLPAPAPLQHSPVASLGPAMVPALGSAARTPRPRAHPTAGLSGSGVLASGVCLSLLTEQTPPRPRKERFAGHEPFSINERLQAPPPAACRAPSPRASLGADPAASPLRASAVPAGSCAGLRRGRDKPCPCRSCWSELNSEVLHN